jgi:hypothetical protein
MRLLNFDRITPGLRERERASFHPESHTVLGGAGKHKFRQSDLCDILLPDYSLVFTRY